MLDIKLSVYNRFPPDLLKYIRDLAYGSPKQIYDRVMCELVDFSDISFCYEGCTLKAVKNRLKLTEAYLRPRTPYTCEETDLTGVSSCNRPVAVAAWENTNLCTECGINDYYSLWFYHNSCL